MKALHQARSAVRSGSSFITKAFGASAFRSLNVCDVLKRHLSLFFINFFFFTFKFRHLGKALIGAGAVGFSMFGTEAPLAKHCLPSPVIGPERKDRPSLASAYLAELTLP